MDKMDNYI